MSDIIEKFDCRDFNHYNCLLCGTHNRFGLGLDFKLLKDGSVYTKFKAEKILQGYEDILHGGVISALMDCAMVHCLFHYGIKAVTADLNIRFIESVPVPSELDLYGEIIKGRKRLYLMRSKLLYNEKIMAVGNAKFIEERSNN